MREREISLRDIFILFLKKLVPILIAGLVVALILIANAVNKNRQAQAAADEIRNRPQLYECTILFRPFSPEIDNKMLLAAYTRVFDSDGSVQESARKTAPGASMSMSAADGLIELKVISTDSGASGEAARYIKAELYNIIRDSLGVHQVEQISEFTGPVPYRDSEGKPISVPSVPSLPKEILMNGIMGFIVGAIACAGIVFFFALASGKFLSVRDFKDSVNIPVLGVINDKEKLSGKLQLHIAKLEGRTSMDKETSYKMTAHSVLAVAGIGAAIFSQTAADAAQSLAEQAGCVYGGNILSEPAAREVLRRSEKIVLLEDVAKINATLFMDELAVIDNYGKQVAGLVIK
ncbi:MAG: hypothetical protein GX975_03295 [Clostridiales bacterium]|nr:hypothetical protein [Clostridiales bacterium]